MEKKSKIFIGSSLEAVERGVVSSVAAWIENADAVPVRWDDPGVFLPGNTGLTQLLTIASSVEAAILVFSDDDVSWYRNQQVATARDNVLIEYGLFGGTLSQSRVAILREGNPRIPSDLAGIIYADYNRQAHCRASIEHWVRHLKADFSKARGSVDEQGLTPNEYIVLKAALSDPRATDRGAWTYPFHQQATRLGLSDEEATAAIGTLCSAGFLLYREIESYDELAERLSTAPAHVVTESGLRAYNKYESSLSG